MSRHEIVYWFKRRRYGWGWFPVTWQGWTMLAVFVAIQIISAIWLLKGKPRHTLTPGAMLYLLLFCVNLAVFIMISYRHAPKPKWRWGTSPTDNSEDF